MSDGQWETRETVACVSLLALYPCSLHTLMQLCGTRGEAMRVHALSLITALLSSIGDIESVP